MVSLSGMRSFIEYQPESHFPIQNLPYGVFSPAAGGAQRIGTVVGDWVIDLALLQKRGLIKGNFPRDVFAQNNLNNFMACGRTAWQAAREQIQSLLLADNPILRDDKSLRRKAIQPRREVVLHLPAAIGDFTDFYSSRDHASNVGRMFRGPDNPLLPNWLHLPVAYHGRASSIVLSGTQIHRPWGQIKPEGEERPHFSPTSQLDFELELGFFVGPGNKLGQPIPVESAADHIFGLVMVNDWSARDIQSWEYRPLGPFLAKNFATSISPWVVTMDALEPFRCAGPAQNPLPLPYLQSAGNQAYDIQLEVGLQTAVMNQSSPISHSNARFLYWNMAQQLAHHTISGCSMRPGDLLASGTISGQAPDSYGSLLELTQRGSRPFRLESGESRTFLEDGDCLTLSGWCQGKGFRVGFGEVTGEILPALRL